MHQPQLHFEAFAGQLAGAALLQHRLMSWICEPPPLMTFLSVWALDIIFAGTADAVLVLAGAADPILVATSTADAALVLVGTPNAIPADSRGWRGSMRRGRCGIRGPHDRESDCGSNCHIYIFHFYFPLALCLLGHGNSRITSVGCHAAIR
jgi:hypothetical protein